MIMFSQLPRQADIRCETWKRNDREGEGKNKKEERKRYLSHISR